MKHARVAFRGTIHDATDADGRIELADGRFVGETDVVWLPPLTATERPRTIFALDLNYANHTKELAFKAPAEPLIFLKAENTLIGHRGQSRRPADATYMHYECELAVIIGRTARRVTRADAYDYVGGYTVANDYTVRDYLENYYRPNLRVKNRDGCTPLGPWRVDAGDVSNPMNLRLTTTVNGSITQRGNTGDMIFDIPFLIAYLSNFMTLFPGDIILTGTPDDLVGVHPGDEVVTEIGSIGRLVSTIIGDDSLSPAA